MSSIIVMMALLAPAPFGPAAKPMGKGALEGHWALEKATFVFRDDGTFIACFVPNERIHVCYSLDGTWRMTGDRVMEGYIGTYRYRLRYLGRNEWMGEEWYRDNTGRQHSYRIVCVFRKAARP